MVVNVEFNRTIAQIDRLAVEIRHRRTEACRIGPALQLMEEAELGQIVGEWIRAFSVLPNPIGAFEYTRFDLGQAEIKIVLIEK